MSHHPNPPAGDDGYLYLVRIPTTRVTAFLTRAFSYTSPADVPLRDPWEAWASQFHDLDELWDACRDPELLLFLHSHSRAASDGWKDACRAWDAFRSSCLESAGLDDEAVRVEEVDEGEPDPEEIFRWFALDAPGAVAGARRAVKAALEARAGAGEDPSLVREELARALKALVPNPFIGSVESSDGQSFWRPLEEEGR